MLLQLQYKTSFSNDRLWNKTFEIKMNIFDILSIHVTLCICHVFQNDFCLIFLTLFVFIEKFDGFSFRPNVNGELILLIRNQELNTWWGYTSRNSFNCTQPKMFFILKTKESCLLQRNKGFSFTKRLYFRFLLLIETKSF